LCAIRGVLRCRRRHICFYFIQHCAYLMKKQSHKVPPLERCKTPHRDDHHPICHQVGRDTHSPLAGDNLPVEELR
jgi:hypothetical protein